MDGHTHACMDGFQNNVLFTLTFFTDIFGSNYGFVALAKITDLLLMVDMSNCRLTTLLHGMIAQQ